MQPRPPSFQDRLRRFARDYAWFIAKNVLGWVLMLISPVLGFALPGPGGIPVFLIGFALVTFPGKRRLTARIFRGITLNLSGNAVGVFSGMASIALPLLALGAIRLRFPAWLEHMVFEWPFVLLLAGIAITCSYALVRLALRVTNRLIALTPWIRRRVRPVMRRKGIDLLPPRRRRRLRLRRPGAVDDEILDIDPRYQRAATSVWKRASPWVLRAAGLLLLGYIFFRMLAPIGENWADVGSQILQFDLWRFVVAALMFAGFLFVFRAMVWRKMLKGFGYRPPIAPTTRIWSTSELARYIPGSVWQVVGRAYFIRPYGVPAAASSTSQVLDVATFVLANLFLGLACMLWFIGKAEADMRPYLYAAALVLPALIVLLHPKIFYTIVNAVLKRFRKQPFSKRLRGKKLTKYFFLLLLGLLWQSLAIWVLLSDVLNIKLDHWWKLAGPYCLAWFAGMMLAFLAPGGLGTRELVFIGLVKLTLDEVNRVGLPEGPALLGLLLFCAVLLRLWTITGELIVFLTALAFDWKGALNRPDAPGRLSSREPLPLEA